MNKIIYWLGKRDNMRWFRKLYYKRTGGRSLWGIFQFILDQNDWSKGDIEFDFEKFKREYPLTPDEAFENE